LPVGRAIFLDGVIGHRDSNGKFDTSGKSPASVLAMPEEIVQ
jgi:hypothetical protein